MNSVNTCITRLVRQHSCYENFSPICPPPCGHGHPQDFLQDRANGELRPEGPKLGGVPGNRL